MPADADHADHLTYGTATPEQVDAARQDARERLAALDAEWTPQRWEHARAELRQRFAAA